MMQRMKGTLRPGRKAGVLALAVLLLTCVLMAGAVSASEVTVGNWAELKSNFTGGKIVKLSGDIEATETITLKTGAVTLDLNGQTITGTDTIGTIFTISGLDASLKIIDSGTNGKIEGQQCVFSVEQGTLIVNNGTITGGLAGKTNYETYSSTINVYGSTVSTDEDYSVVTIGADAEVAGYCYAVGVNATSGAAYGVNITVNGQLTGISSISSGADNSYGSGAISILGTIQGTSGNVPMITINEGAVLTGYQGKNSNVGYAAGPAIYAAGYGKWIINGGTFTGDEALSIKSGNWTINGGKFTGNGPFFDPAVSNGNGSEPTGAAVSITTNHAYAKNVELTITGGEFISEHQSAFYEGGNRDHPGTALIGVKISGGSSFTTKNESLSAVTIHNSGNTTITNGKGISITDAAGNNLLYRGVNLTDVAAEWTSDATNGYTLSITAPGSYKLMDDVTISSMTVSAENVVIDGNKDTYTLTLSGTKQGVITVNNGATLQNLKVVAAEYATFGTAIMVNSGNLTDSTIDLTNQNAQPSDTGRMSAIAVFVKNGDISGNTIQAGNSATSSSQCVVVNGDGVTVSGNTLTTGESAAEKEKGERTSGSVGIRLSGVSTTTTIADNHITSTKGAGLNNGIAADGVENDVTITASGNTFVLAATEYGGGAFYVNPKSSVNTVTLNANGNTVESAASFIYADNAEGAATYAISGAIENNDFAAADEGLVSADADRLTLTLENFKQSGNSGLITDPSESLTVDTVASEITVTGATVDENGENAIIAFTGYTILITNATVDGSDTIYYKGDSAAIVTHDTVRHMGSLTDIDVKLLITDMPKLEEISTPKATIGDAEKAQLAAEKITPLSVVDIHHKGEPGFDRITLTISGSGLAPSDKIIGFHVGASGVDTSEVTTQDGKHIVKFTDLTSASPFGIGVISDEPQPTPLPPSYSSGDGNMENAYRVLFNDGSTTLSVVTDLSSGDKLTKPATPVKDGYTFAGWYKDSACTQAWDFETGIPGDMTLYAKWTAAGSSGETEATATPTATAVTTPQPTKTQSTTATTSAPQATTAAGVSPTLTQAPAPVAGALFGLLAAGVLLRRRFQ